MFEKLISWEMALRGNGARARAGKLIRRMWPDFRLSSFLLRTTGSVKQVTVNGKRMYVDLWDSAVSVHLFVAHTWEPEETSAISSRLKPGDVFVDVGANLGYFTLIASDAVGPGGKVFAFEPGPHNFSLLEKNVRINRCANVICERKAVTETNRTLELHLSSFNYGDHRIFRSHDDADYNRGRQRQSTTVAGVALDSYFPPGARVDFLKLDVQGAEYFALQGMKRVLRDNPGVVVLMEFWPHALREAGVEPNALLDELEELGFHCYRAEAETIAPFPHAEILQTSGDNSVNLVLSRRKLD